MENELIVVFKVLHVHVMPDGEEDFKTIGFYISEADANKAITRAAKLPGFRDVPDGFVIERHVVDEENPREDHGFLSR